jgi:hypothetical protein
LGQLHLPEVRAEALAFVKAGLNDCEISRRLSIPRSTIRDWRSPRYVRKTLGAICPRCSRSAKPMWFTDEDYAELLRSRGWHRAMPLRLGIAVLWEMAAFRMVLGRSVSGFHSSRGRRSSLMRSPGIRPGMCLDRRLRIHQPNGRPRHEPYEYLSYEFSNMSRDIIDLFVRACDRVGLFTRVNCDRRGRWDVRINRRDSLALMLEHVGRKA